MSREAPDNNTNNNISNNNDNNSKEEGDPIDSSKMEREVLHVLNALVGCVAMRYAAEKSSKEITDTETLQRALWEVEISSTVRYPVAIRPPTGLSVRRRVRTTKSIVSNGGDNNNSTYSYEYNKARKGVVVGDGGTQQQHYQPAGAAACAGTTVVTLGSNQTQDLEEKIMVRVHSLGSAKFLFHHTLDHHNSKKKNNGGGGRVLLRGGANGSSDVFTTGGNRRYYSGCDDKDGGGVEGEDTTPKRNQHQNSEGSSSSCHNNSDSNLLSSYCSCPYKLDARANNGGSGYDDEKEEEDGNANNVLSLSSEFDTLRCKFKDGGSGDARMAGNTNRTTNSTNNRSRAASPVDREPLRGSTWLGPEVSPTTHNAQDPRFSSAHVITFEAAAWPGSRRRNRRRRGGANAGVAFWRETAARRGISVVSGKHRDAHYGRGCGQPQRRRGSARHHMISSYQRQVAGVSGMVGGGGAPGQQATGNIPGACHQGWSGGGAGGEELSACGGSERIPRSSGQSTLLTGNYPSDVIACRGERENTTSLGGYDYSAAAKETIRRSTSPRPPEREMCISSSIATPCSSGEGGRVVAIVDSPVSRPCGHQGARQVGATGGGGAQPPTESPGRISDDTCNDEELVGRAQPNGGADECNGGGVVGAALLGAHGKGDSSSGSLAAASPKETNFGTTERCDKEEEREGGTKGEKVSNEDVRHEPVTNSSDNERSYARRSMIRSASSPLAGGWDQGSRGGEHKERYADVGDGVGAPPRCSTTHGASRRPRLKPHGTSDRYGPDSAASEIGRSSTEDDNGAIESTGGQGSAAVVVTLTPVQFSRPGLVNAASAAQESRVDPRSPPPPQQHQQTQWLQNPKRRSSSAGQDGRSECTVSRDRGMLFITRRLKQLVELESLTILWERLPRRERERLDRQQHLTSSRFRVSEQARRDSSISVSVTAPSFASPSPDTYSADGISGEDVGSGGGGGGGGGGDISTRTHGGRATPGRILPPSDAALSSSIDLPLKAMSRDSGDGRVSALWAGHHRVLNGVSSRGEMRRTDKTRKRGGGGGGGRGTSCGVRGADIGGGLVRKGRLKDSSLVVVGMGTSITSGGDQCRGRR